MLRLAPLLRPPWFSFGHPLSSYSTRSDTGGNALTLARSFLRSLDLDAVPRESCEMSFSRSSGPGGQNVNKLNTKATLRCASQYLTKEGDLVISSQRSRTQEQNREDCFRKLISILRQTGAETIEGETTNETRQKISNLIRQSNDQRLKSKKMHSSKKGARRSRGGEN